MEKNGDWMTGRSYEKKINDYSTQEMERFCIQNSEED